MDSSSKIPSHTVVSIEIPDREWGGRQHYAIRLDEYALNYSVDVLKYCIDKGFDPKQYAHIMHYALTNQPLQSPSAVRPEEYQSIIQKMQLLLEHGADMNGEDHYKFTPLFTALGLQYDMAPVITFMITKGANVNAKSVNKLYLSNRRELPAGMTPLMLATATNQNRHVEILLQHGADTSIHDADGKTVREYAEEFADVEIQALLKTAADPSASHQ